MSYSKIIDNLYLGNQYSTEQLHHVHLIISVGCNSKHTINQNTQNMKIPLRDKDSSDITPFIDPVCDVINEYLLNNKKVLIHCKAGINRSTAFVVAYLMIYKHMDIEQSKNHIARVRRVKFKPNFINQIINHIK